MRYRIGETYDPSRSNESRANQIEHALTVASDKNGEQTAADEIRSGVYTDVSDLLASVRHFCDRAGIDYHDVDDHADRAYAGDIAEDGDAAKRDTERFPEED
jgi:hypothetical protein